MRELWTFASEEKLDKFRVTLDAHEIPYVAEAKGSNRHSISVDEKDYPKARKLLLKHKERRTSADSM